MAERYRRANDLVELAGMMRTSLYGVSVEMIAEHFEVSRRTAERMLAAIRSRSPELAYEVRDAQKYWRLPSSTSFPSLELPKELESLSKRVIELEAKVIRTRKQSDCELACVEAALGGSPVGIFILDSNSRVIWVNDALLEYFGLEEPAIMGRDKRSLIRQGIREIFEESAEFERRVLATYDDNTYIENFQCHVLPHGPRQERWLEHWSQPILHGPYAGGRIEHYVDITKRVLEQQQNRRSRRSLPAREGQLRQHERARKLAKLAGDLIRDPVARLNACATEAIDSGIASPAMKEVLQLAQQIERATANMQGKLLKAEPELSAVSLPPLLGGLADALRAPMAEREITVQLEISPEAKRGEVWLDPELIEWVLFELVCNAARAMPEGGTVTLMAEVVGCGSYIWLAVQDTGPGIPRDQRDFVFSPFYTTHDNAAGVGLSKAQQIAFDHGGEIGIEATGQGTILYLELPVEHPTAASID